MKETVFKEVSKSINVKFNEPINIWFFGDIHRDTEACDIDRWRWFMKRAKEDDPEKTYFMGLGDYNDFASASEQKAMTGGKLHETTIAKFDEVVQRDNRALAAEISFMRGRILGMVEGNHTWYFMDGQTATQDLASRLSSEWLGWLCHYRLILIPIKGKSQAVDIVLCHGKAGGKTAGVTINQVDDLRRVFPAADIYVMGHDHQRGAWPKSVLIPNSANGKLKQKRQFLCRSGSFKKAYTPGTSSYEAGRLFQPADLGALKLRIGLHRDRSDGGDTIITDIEAVI